MSPQEIDCTPLSAGEVDEVIEDRLEEFLNGKALDEEINTLDEEEDDEEEI